MRNNVNYPLMRELKEIGVVTDEATPKQIGPFKIKTEAFVGDSSGNTKTLAETPLENGIFAAISIPTDGTNDNVLSALTEGTHFTISSATLTWITDQSSKNVFMCYAY